MATQTLYMSPISFLIQLFNNVGLPLQGGFVNTYVAGSVNTPLATFTDSTGTTQNANPIALSSTGRLVAASGAPVACWVPAGVNIKMVITDASGAFILGLDNIPAWNDPTALLTLLATVSSSSVLGGADIVANAMRSYDVIASVRAAAPPSLASGQTVVIDVEGGVLVNDGNGGLFYWNPTSTATDDGVNVVKPTSIASGNPGRYLRQINLFGTATTFQTNVTGCTTAPTLTCNVVQNGNLITVRVPDTGVLVSNSTAFGLSNWPAILRDNLVGFASSLVPAMDNSAAGAAAYCTIANAIGSNAASFVLNTASGLWTATGNKEMTGFTMTYILPNGHP